MGLGQGLGFTGGRVPVADGFVDFAGHRGAGLAARGAIHDHHHHGVARLFIWREGGEPRG